MHILLTADAELPVPPTLYGGIERVIASLVEAYRKQGHTVGLAARQHSTVTCDAFYPWPGLTSTQRRDSWSNALALRRAVKHFGPDVVHSFSRLMWLLPLLPSRVPRLMSYQREPTGRTVAWSHRLHGKRLRFTGCSEHICASGRAGGGGNWTTVPNFIEPQKFTFVPAVNDNAPLVFLSRLEHIKGVHTAIAMAQASGRRLLIAGNRVETDEGRSYWENEIEPHLGRDGIEYVGPVDDNQKNTLLGSAAAMVVPIEWEEPFGIVFAEALACGTPIISSPRGSLPEIVQPGITGFLVDSVAAGKSAIERLHELDRTACRVDAETRFSVEPVANRYLQLYTEMQTHGNP